MDNLRRPLLPDGPLTTIVEVDVEKGAGNQPQSLGSGEHTSSDTGTTTRTPTRRGKKQVLKRERSTWGGSESRKTVAHKKPKRITDLAQRPADLEVPGYPTSLASYNIHQDGYGLEPAHHSRRGSEVSPTPSIRRSTSSFSENGPEEVFSDDGGGVIDGMFSMDGGHDFVDVRLDTTLGGEDGMSTTQELIRCKKTVLVFYLNFLKVIGWRRWRGARQDLATPLYTNALNLIYPSFIFSLMCLACVTQYLTCFFRDEVQYRGDETTGVLIVKCKRHIVTGTVIADVLLLTAYLFGVYLFRYGEPEHLSALMERVYLSFNFKHRVSPQTRLTFTLRMILSMGAVWVLLSLAGNILRLLSLRLLKDTTFLSSINSGTDFTNISSSEPRNTTETVIQYALVIYSIFGFVLFDLLYVAVVLSYVSHAQLLLTYINSIVDKVRTKAYDLGKAIRDMNQFYEYLKVLNGKLSSLTSLCLFLFITTSISSLVGLAGIERCNDDHKTHRIAIAVGVVNFTQWTLLALAPLIQAARLTSYCRKLRRLGLEVGARPFSYHDTPQLVLDSFLHYTNATRYTAKLAGMHIYPSYMIGFFFVLGIVANWYITTFNSFSFAPWF